jgi:hypothetical protein
VDLPPILWALLLESASNPSVKDQCSFGEDRGIQHFRALQNETALSIDRAASKLREPSGLQYCKALHGIVTGLEEETRQEVRIRAGKDALDLAFGNRCSRAQVARNQLHFCKGT